MSWRQAQRIGCVKRVAGLVKVSSEFFRVACSAVPFLPDEASWPKLQASRPAAEELKDIRVLAAGL
jgi:hypothetical protein